jgi:hypothetical protein
MSKSCTFCGNKEDHYGKGTLPLKRISRVGNVCSDCSQNSSDRELRDNKRYNNAMTRAVVGPKKAKEKGPQKGGSVKSSGVCRGCNVLKSLSWECAC